MMATCDARCEPEVWLFIDGKTRDVLCPNGGTTYSRRGIWGALLSLPLSRCSRMNLVVAKEVCNGDEANYSVRNGSSKTDVQSANSAKLRCVHVLLFHFVL